jgi:hypothetical protein
MPPFEERVARNEALFREVNERVLELAVRTDRSIGFVCECGDEACVEHVEVPLAVYEQVRANARRFVVLPGHVTVEIEHVVMRTDGYAIVEKDAPTSVRIVEANDPRA